VNAEVIGFSILTVTNILAAFIIFAGALREKMRLYPTWHKLGLIVAALGLSAQAFRNIQFLYTGVSPADNDMPLWALKDAGISLVAFGYLYLAATGKYDAAMVKIHSKPAAKKVKRRK
jgi:hypothetical protein